MKVAIVHYWLVSMRGGEKVVEALGDIFPEADIFTHVMDPSRLSESLKRHRIQTTFIQKLPQAVRRYRSYLPLMPLALEELDLSGYDLVISSEAGPAKGVITSSRATHICYCHTPMRYAWDQYPLYRDSARGLKRLLMSPVMHYMRLWDVASAARVDEFVANSLYVAGRIRKTYRRRANVIYPPVDVERITVGVDREEFYLTVTQFVPYKRLDLIVAAFNQLGRPLVMIGDGPDWKRVRSLARPNIKLLGWQTDEVVRAHMGRCRAFVFAAEEEFGIAPVEAQAAGAPVIAYGVGGVTETVIPQQTGVFFRQPTVAALMSAVQDFEAKENQFDRQQIRQNALRFSRERFMSEFRHFAEQASSAQPRECAAHVRDAANTFCSNKLDQGC